MARAQLLIMPILRVLFLKYVVSIDFRILNDEESTGTGEQQGTFGQYPGLLRLPVHEEVLGQFLSRPHRKGPEPWCEAIRAMQQVLSILYHTLLYREMFMPHT